ncbi:MAG TPA: TSUP family transporter, partial [Steroidobacteraceae bacterium]|nr:TSUP family transporter [Steroidobacteraceae bacterium]
MPTERVLLYLALVLVNLTAIVVWLLSATRRRLRDRPPPADVAIGFVANFLDTLGIGSYAQITALFKMRGRPADELIPGTLNVGGIVPSFVGCWLFVVAITVEPVLLLCMVVSAAMGAWIGADIVSRLPKRAIQIFMGVALLIAAAFFLLANLGISTPPGSAMGLTGWRFGVAIACNFAFGALMCVGIGNYAP